MWFKKVFAAFTKKERLVFLIASAGAVISFVVVMGIMIAQITKAVPAAGGEYIEGLVGHSCLCHRKLSAVHWAHPPSDQSLQHGSPTR